MLYIPPPSPVLLFGLGAVAGGVLGGKAGSALYSRAGGAAVLRTFGLLQASVPWQPRSAAYLPHSTPPAQACAALPMLWIVLAIPAAPPPLPGSSSGSGGGASPPALAYAMAALGGCVASLTGPNLKAALLNANPPEHRAAVFTLAYLFDSVAKGVAPTAIGLVMVYAAGASGGWGLSREGVFAVALCGWVASGAIIAAAGFTVAADERRAVATSAKQA